MGTTVVHPRTDVVELLHHCALRCWLLKEFPNCLWFYSIPYETDQNYQIKIGNLWWRSRQWATHPKSTENDTQNSWVHCGVVVLYRLLWSHVARTAALSCIRSTGAYLSLFRRDDCKACDILVAFCVQSGLQVAVVVVIVVMMIAQDSWVIER